jgi:hypothetical protein
VKGARKSKGILKGQRGVLGSKDFGKANLVVVVMERLV